MNDCKYCNWYGVAHNGKLCVKCGKICNYIPPQTNPFPPAAAIWVDYGPEPDAVHGWFGLSYASYLALPRSILQNMPDSWQNRFVACLNELSDMVNFDDNYSVNLRDKKGRFIKDPLAQYRRFPKEKVPWRK
jgi:hypothetical protein